MYGCDYCQGVKFNSMDELIHHAHDAHGYPAPNDPEDPRAVLAIKRLRQELDCALLQIRELQEEVEPRDYVYICTPTGRELPEMFAHWRGCGYERVGEPMRGTSERRAAE